MTNEEVWEVIDSKFTGKASSKYGGCKYLTEDDRRCAIGLFIPDGAIIDNGVEVSGLLELNPKLWNNMPSKNEDLLKDWQVFHDKELSRAMPLKEQKLALFNKFVALRKEYAV